MKLLDPLEGVKNVASCTAFQFVFILSTLSVLIKYWSQAEPALQYPGCPADRPYDPSCDGPLLAQQMMWIAV